MRYLLRLLFVSLLVVLLPLRGWAGNAMAIDMVANITSNSALSLEESIATAGQMPMPMLVPMPMPADCAMHSQPSTDVVADDDAAHCTGCDTCGLCLAVSNVAQVQWPTSHVLHHSSPSASDVRFSSAVKISDLRPPIS